MTDTPNIGPTPEMELAALKAIVRNYRACLKHLFAAKNDKLKNYWGSATNHWQAEMDLLLSHGKPMQAAETLPDLIRQFNDNITALHKEQPIIAHDLGYRFNTILETLLLEPVMREVVKASMTISKSDG